MKRRFLYGLLVTVLGLNLFVGAQIYFYSAQAGDRDDPHPNIKLFVTVLDRVRQEYVDGEKVSYRDLIYGALKGMVNNLDPHSEFMEPVKFTEMKSDTEGAFGGVGLIITSKTNMISVVEPMEDSPALRAGFLPGDRIIKIEGKSTEKMSVEDAKNKLRGPPNAPVSITIFRPSTGETKEFKIARAVIKVPSVKDINNKTEFPLSENNVGYVRITQFGEKTADDFERALKRLESGGMQSLVLDLRGNPGGLLDSAVRICEKFLPRNQLVVSTEGRGSTPKAEYRVTSRDKSEIVAGCLQDTTALGVTKAVILGEQTFGKGSVQSVIPLPVNSALRLTTAKYYTPSHRVIHEKGITPDITIPMTEDEERDVFLKRIPGGLDSLDDRDRERVKNARDPQLDRAMDLLKGISLYTKRPVPEKMAAKGSEKIQAKQ
ncbi:MAG: carboxyl-terminal protease [Verrucomicrobia bacterium]|nr:MAG: carboxyl-terminal protease [Verrucomicrobiota bacterium]